MQIEQKNHIEVKKEEFIKKLRDYANQNKVEEMHQLLSREGMLKENLDWKPHELQTIMNETFIYACTTTYDYTGTANYLLNSPHLLIKPNIHYNGNEAFIKACMDGRIYTLKFLTEHSTWNQKLLTEENMLEAFDLAVRYYQHPIIDYLVYEMELEMPNYDKIRTLLYKKQECEYYYDNDNDIEESVNYAYETLHKKEFNDKLKKDLDKVITKNSKKNKL